MSGKSKSKLPSGFKDYLPEEEKRRGEMLDTIKRSCELFGFAPLDTPAVEYERTLSGGDAEFKKQIFRIRREDEKENLALRFDLTVPLARVVASYPAKIKMPFKRYAVGKVWRGERPQAGRFREFLQFDADIVGSRSILADAEIIALMNHIMLSLGFQNFLIKVNNRKVLNGLPAYAGFPGGRLDPVLRIIDKLDKKEKTTVLDELSSKVGGGLSKKEARAVVDFLNIKAKNKRELLSLARGKIANGESREGLDEMERLMGHLKAMGVPDDKWTFDFATVRGLAYYTGFVFETVLLDLAGVGSVFSGGRYDELISKLGGVPEPAVGTSVGVDRMFYAMERLGIFPAVHPAARVIVLNFDEKATVQAEEAVATLRSDGIASDLYLGKERGLTEQLSYALKSGYEIAVIVGEKERAKGTVSIKNFASYEQREVKAESMVSTIEKWIEEKF